MIVQDFDFDSGLLERFLAWPRQHYAGDPNWLPNPGEAGLLAAGAHPGAVWRNFLILQGDSIRGRVTALANPHLCDEHGRPYAQLGFFECVDDLPAARLLLDTAAAWLSAKVPQARTLLAPIDFDTWHAYRLRTTGFDQPTFLMEPYNPPYYPALFTALGFEPRLRYVTKTVDDLSALRTAWQPYHQKAISQGYTFRSFNPAARESQLGLIYRLSLAAFHDNRLFAEISEDEFRALYGGLAGSVDPELLFFVLDPSGEPAGISFSVRDHAEPATVNFKTYGVLPRLHGSGVGAALACESYGRFQAKGFVRVNHCLMRAGNRADAFDRGLAQVTREYAIYQRSLHG